MLVLVKADRSGRISKAINRRVAPESRRRRFQISDFLRLLEPIRNTCIYRHAFSLSMVPCGWDRNPANYQIRFHLAKF